MVQVELPISLDLKDRTLWFDGDSSMSSDRMADLILSGRTIDGIYPTEVNSSVKKFNLYADQDLNIKTQIRPLDTSFCIPEKYLNINLKKFFLRKLNLRLEQSPNLTPADIDKRLERVLQEIDLFEKYGMQDLIRTAIYLIDIFEENQIVWGTGRGSSCTCYCLYLIGLHEVDSVYYDLDLNEFFR